MNQCLTCHGTGMTASDDGPLRCTDCFGEGTALGLGARLEWRLRAIEGAHREARGESAADIAWLVHELRATREALVRIMARCQDADDSDETARAVHHLVNEALGLYQTK
jgi:hypothetical protein